MNVECGAVCSRVCRYDLCIVLCAPNRIRRLTSIDATEITINRVYRDYDKDRNQVDNNTCMGLLVLSRVVTLGSNDLCISLIGVRQCFRR